MIWFEGLRFMCWVMRWLLLRMFLWVSIVVLGWEVVFEVNWMLIVFDGERGELGMMGLMCFVLWSYMVLKVVRDGYFEIFGGLGKCVFELFMMIIFLRFFIVGFLMVFVVRFGMMVLSKGMLFFFWLGLYVRFVMVLMMRSLILRWFRVVVICLVLNWGFSGMRIVFNL